MKKNTLILLLVIFIVGIFISLNAQPSKKTIENISVSSSREQTKNNEKIGKEQNTNTDKITLIPDNFTPSVILKRTTYNKQKNRPPSPEGWRNIFNNPAYIFTGIIAIFTILLVCAGFWQLWIARDNEKRQLRAYVFVDTINIWNIWGDPPPAVYGQKIPPTGPWIYRPQEGPIVYVTIKNSGRTPSYDTIHRARACFREFPLVGNLNAFQDIPSTYTMSIPADGKTSQTIVMAKPLNQEQIGRLDSMQSAIYLYGEIIYRDAFGKKQVTTYRFFYNRMAGIIGLNTTMIGHDQGNKAT